MARRLDTLRGARLEKLNKLRSLGINPYPPSYDEEITPLAKARDLQGKTVAVAGRIMAWREHGEIVFADILGQGEQLQLWFQKSKLGERFDLLPLFDLGDFIGAKGEVVKTKAGEISLDIESFKMLSKALRPIPSEWHGLKDIEERYRKRYLDLLLDPEIRKRFETRTKLIREVRNYLDNLGFLEVETPTLQNQYGGANAKPFKTHLNALDTDVYLRIADELYLKRLVVGGYEKVYEICKDFRNEGMDLTHNPEFTMIEYYEAYADYNQVMDVTEGLFKHLAKHVKGTDTLEVGEHKVDIGKKWARVTMTDLLQDKLDLDVEKETEESLTQYCRKNNIELLGGETKGQLIFTIFEHKVTEALIEPTWVIDYPKEVSPLSKDHRTKPGWVERFEGYIGGKEICDGWSELTDPVIQRERFEADTSAVRRDKQEAQTIDEDFLEAMEYGMPPLGGIGIGIDRLTMFFTNTWSIKEVILFPLVRPKNS